jgi:hypothetical protein
MPLQNGLNTSSKHYLEAIKIIGNAVKNVITQIVEFMVIIFLFGFEISIRSFFL